MSDARRQPGDDPKAVDWEWLDTRKYKDFTPLESSPPENTGHRADGRQDPPPLADRLAPWICAVFLVGLLAYVVHSAPAGGPVEPVYRTSNGR